MLHCFTMRYIHLVIMLRCLKMKNQFVHGCRMGSEIIFSKDLFTDFVSNFSVSYSSSAQCFHINLQKGQFRVPLSRVESSVFSFCRLHRQLSNLEIVDNSAFNCHLFTSL